MIGALLTYGLFIMFETIFLALAFGTFWFYALCFMVFILILALEENDHEFFSMGVIVAFIILMEHAGSFDLLASPWVLVQWTVVYMVAGVVWSFVKWFAFLHKEADVIRELRFDFLQMKMKGNDINFDIGKITEKTKVPAELKSEFRNYLKEKHYLSRRMYDGYDDNTLLVPMVKNYKAKITRWIIWWPTSAVWTLLSDPLVRFANFVFSRLKGTYQRIANKVFAEFE